MAISRKAISKVERCNKSKFNAHFHNIISDKTKGCHGNKLHLSAVTKATEFVKQIEGKNLPITQVMDETS